MPLSRSSMGITEEDRDTHDRGTLEIVQRPDFPTGATILGTRGIEEAYRTDAARSVCVRTNIETLPNGKSRIIVTELPYLVNKARLIEKIAEPYVRQENRRNHRPE